MCDVAEDTALRCEAKKKKKKKREAKKKKKKKKKRKIRTHTNRLALSNNDAISRNILSYA